MKTIIAILTIALVCATGHGAPESYVDAYTLDEAGNRISAVAEGGTLSVTNRQETIIYDLGGRAANIHSAPGTANATSGNWVFINEVHEAIEEGFAWHYSVEDEDFDDNELLRLMIIPDSGYEIHSVFSVEVQGDAKLRVIVGSTTSTNGTAVIPYNRNQTTDHTNTNDRAALWLNPTLSVTGTVLEASFRISGGSGNKTDGGGGATRFEWIVDESRTNMIFEIQSKAGADNKWASIQLEYYWKE